MKKLIFIILFVLQMGLVSAEEFIFEKITSQQGLSQNDVNCIFQDHNGFLWIGTNDGLNRYDGYSFKTYRIDTNKSKGEGLSSNLVFQIKEDKKGRLWIATSNEGVCVFNLCTEEFTQIRNTSSNPIRLADNRILDLECMNDGSVWIATEKGVTIITEQNGKFETTNLISLAQTPLVSKACNVVVEDNQGRKCLGLHDGLIVCKTNNTLLECIEIAGLEDFNVRCILPAYNGYIIGTGEGLFFLDNVKEDLGKSKLIQINDLPATEIYLDERKNLFVASQLKLLVYSCDCAKNKFVLNTEINQGRTKADLSSNMVMSIYGDSSGIIWIGTNGGGLNKYNPKRKKIGHYKNTSLPGSLSSNKIRSVFEDSNKNIWIGTEGGGVNFLNTSKGRNFESGFEHYFVNEYQVENRIYSIIETDKENGESEIWAGAAFPQTLECFKNSDQLSPISKEELCDKISASIFTSLKDKDGNIWLGTYGSKGLYKYEKKEGKYHLLNYKAKAIEGGLSSNIIRSLLQDSMGNMWIGTDAGINLLTVEELKKEKPFFKVFRNNRADKNSLSNDYILPLFISSKGDLWAGTMGGGLNRVNCHETIDSITFTRFDTSDGFPNNVIKGILEDEEGNLWISSNKGLSKFNTENYSIMNYDVSDGLQDNEFSELACCKLSDGMMIFGGVNGFNTFYPEEINADMMPPKVAFTDLQVLNKSVKVGELVNKREVLTKAINQTQRIKLKYSENSFAIYFSALHFSAPTKNKYKYMLEGFDEDWIIKNSDERFAKYTSLDPGTYVFKLYASNNDGIWSEKAREIEVLVVPPWWKSNAAMVIYLIVLVYILWFFQRFSFIRIKQKNDLLMEHFEKEKIEELNQMKFRFFTNISHEFRTPLTLIIGSVQKLLQREEELSPKAKAKCMAIQRNSALMLRLINQLMDFRKMEHDKMSLSVRHLNIVELLKEIYSSFAEVASNKNIQFNFSLKEQEAYVWIDSDKIEKIVYNLLSNAFKFTKAGGQIDLILHLESNHILIQVKDNGIGIPQEMQPHVFERFYQGDKLKQADSNGTGIGLSFSKGLAELHGGEISFNSAEGVGSCFELKLKRGKEHYKLSDLEKDQSEGVKSIAKIKMLEETYTSKDLKNDFDAKPNHYKLLIVEDNDELLNFLSESFGDYYEVYRAINGQEGINMAEQYDVDIIVSDVAMPVKDGFQLCKEIRTKEQTSHIPIILLTAKTSAEDSIKGFQLGADAYVPKPFDLQVLEAQIASVLKNRDELKQRFRKSIEITPSEVTTTSFDEKFLNKLLVIIEDNISNFEFSVEKLASLYGMPQVNINKKLKALTGHTASAFIRNVRLKRACQLLKTGRYTVADVTYEVGFSDLKYFRSCFKKEFKLNPSEYAKEKMKPEK
ncbi:hybrid sensor histidine kinase/response regulator transcription factor [Marinifilum sp. RC60d5]|uniref:hybrid sensor histidine kinase/response regulator transcription factor n=1 Tax=Marinifilum sp. RC60d5 TaxID=3458414 RepID=UPI004035EAE4